MAEKTADELIDRLAKITWPSGQQFRTGEIKRETVRRILKALTHDDCQTIIDGL